MNYFHEKELRLEGGQNSPPKKALLTRLDSLELRNDERELKLTSMNSKVCISTEIDVRHQAKCQP